MTLGIFGSVAQWERELISSRTKNGLAALKARGVKLGSPQNLTLEARKKGIVIVGHEIINPNAIIENLENKTDLLIIETLETANVKNRPLTKEEVLDATVRSKNLTKTMHMHWETDYIKNPKFIKD